eukprot:766518-Hanusia_phi.AAC.7
MASIVIPVRWLWSPIAARAVRKPGSDLTPSEQQQRVRPLADPTGRSRVTCKALGCKTPARAEAGRSVMFPKSRGLGISEGDVDEKERLGGERRGEERRGEGEAEEKRTGRDEGRAGCERNWEEGKRKQENGGQDRTGQVDRTGQCRTGIKPQEGAEGREGRRGGTEVSVGEIADLS